MRREDKETKKSEIKKRLREISAALEELDKKDKVVKKKDWKAYAQSIMDKLFTEFKAGAAWLQWAKDHVEQHGYVYSPLGGRRNLYGVLTGIEAIQSAMGRRGMNSPIQGMASQVAMTACRLVCLHFYRYIKKWCELEAKDRWLPAEIMKFVHDALYSEVPYKHVLAYIHILQWCSTYGVAEYYEKEFGIKFVIEPEIDIEVDASEDQSYKWDWSKPHLKETLIKAIKDQEELGQLEEGQTVEDVLRIIYKPYKNPELKAWLEENYPILGI